MNTKALVLLGLLLSGTAWAQPGPAAAGNSGEKRPDLMGRVVAVAEDGSSVTLAMPPRPAEGQPLARDAKPEEVKVILTGRTKALFFGVSDDQARPAIGLMAMVWLEEGSRDQAARVRFMKREGEERPDVQGRIVAVSPDGKSITVEAREVDRATGQDRPAGKVDVRLAPYTQSLYYGVEAGGARPSVDYLVVAWFEKGSKETAARIRFMKNEPQSGVAPPR